MNRDTILLLPLFGSIITLLGLGMILTNINSYNIGYITLYGSLAFTVFSVYLSHKEFDKWEKEYLEERFGKKEVQE